MELGKGHARDYLAAVSFHVGTYNGKDKVGMFVLVSLRLLGSCIMRVGLFGSVL